MSEEFKVEIVNPEKSFFSSENVTEVIVPAFEGEMGILKEHISIISFLKPGIIKIFSKNVEEKFYVDDGIVEFKDNNLSVLTSSIFNLKDFDKSVIDKNLSEAVDLWCKDKKKAYKLYGHISLWNTKNVTNMNRLFLTVLFPHGMLVM